MQQQQQVAPQVEYPAFSFANDYIPSFFGTGMFLVEIEKAVLNSRNEPFITFKVLDSPDGRMKNARRSENFFINSASDKAKKLWREKLTELLQSMGIKALASEAELTKLVGMQVVLAFSKAGRDELPSFRQAGHFDKLWQPRSVTQLNSFHQKQPF